MNKLSVFAVVLSIVALIGVYGPRHTDGQAHQETVYERVLRTGTIRCGYALWPQFVMKDPGTGEMSGFIVEYMNAVGKALGLKVDWPEEVGYGTSIEDLQSDRIDMMCGIWPSPARSKQVDFSVPIEYTAIVPLVRVDDPRFDDDLRKADSPSVTVSVIDGDMAMSIAQQDFPHAKLLSLPQMSDFSLMLSNVADGKADITFSDVTVGLAFMHTNPNKIKILHPENPLRIGAASMAVKKGQQDFLNMLNTTTEELLSSGVIERLLVKYEKYPGSFYRAAKPFETKLGAQK
ncbi:MAG: ABC transporter substrate-binding protein [Bdellovibrionales bacterium]